MGRRYVAGDPTGGRPFYWTDKIVPGPSRSVSTTGK